MQSKHNYAKMAFETTKGVVFQGGYNADYKRQFREITQPDWMFLNYAMNNLHAGVLEGGGVKWMQDLQ